MLAVEIRFLAGRYHATPWGRHVNEGDVEWPPSPWRVLRALLATGFAKLGWREVPTEARALLAELARVSPEVWLPSGTPAHTRHFMPPFSGNKNKVLDAFIDVGRDGALVIAWEVTLEQGALDVLDRLLEGLSYLGRAEAWVDAARVGDVRAGLHRCVASDVSPGPGYERVALLAPLDAPTYDSWRAGSVEKELTRTLVLERAAAEAKGKKARAKLSKKSAERVEHLYPLTMVDALLADTGALQRAGWSQPPGSRWVSYWRDDRLLLPEPARPTGVVAARGPAPTTALLALSSDTRNGEKLPKLTDAVLRLDALHDALVRHSDEGEGPSPCFTGGDANGARLVGHIHASLLPLSLSGTPGRMDHVLVHAPMGFDDRALTALRRVRTTYAKGIPKIFVTLAGVGGIHDFASVVPGARCATVWESRTPFVPPRHLKLRGRNTLRGQLVAELESRGIAMPERIEVEVAGAAGPRWVPVDDWNTAGVSPRWRHFRRARLDPSRAPPTMRAFGLRLTFAEPRVGPLSLGYASHFGLGVFEPVS